MKIVIIILCAFLSVTSCKEISFREPQPAGRKPLNETPKSLKGKYLTVQENGDLSKDTVIISNRGYRFGYFDASQRSSSDLSRYDEGVLSDSLILKSYKGYYFLNINQNPEWLLRVIKQEKNGDLIYMAPEQEGVDFKDYIKKLSAEIKIDSIEVNQEMLYQIDPSPNQLLNLIEKGFFSRTVLKKLK